MASVKWSQLNRWSVVEVEFGIPRKYIEGDLRYVDIQNKYTKGINTDNEFSFKHMAIVLSKNINNSTITVVPLTEASQTDINNDSILTLEYEKYKLFLSKDTKIAIDNIITIEKKVRIKKIVLQFIPLPLRRKILKAMYRSFRL